MKNVIRLCPWVCVVLFAASALMARVVRVEVTSRADVLDGKAFGTAGAYEKIVGRVYFAVNPNDPHNLMIVDLDKARRNAQGEVEFSADLYLFRPKDTAKGNGALLLEIPNRGGKGLLRLIDGATTGGADPTKASDFGDGWLMRQGYTFGWLGWQWDVADDPGNMRLYAPVAKGKNGPLTGLLRDDFTLSEKKYEMPLGHVILGRIGGKEYPVADPNDARNVLTVRDSPNGPRHVVPRGDWSFAQTVDGKLVPSDRYFHLNSEFAPGKIYELVYVVKDPVVAGLGLAAVRDFVSYEKHDGQAVAPVQRVYALGISQCGRFLRHFVWQGFNADEQGRRALDGVLAHVAGAGRGSFNHRFAQPSRDAQPMSSIFYPTDLFPFTDLPETDPLTGQTAGLLDRARAAKVVPKMFLSNTSYEYWGRAGSLVTTSLSRKSSAGSKVVCEVAGCIKDADISPDVRVYLLAGLQHFSGPFPPDYGKGDLKGQQLMNPNPVRWLWRAMITNMNAWVKDGVQPPPSAYPRVSDGTLVPLDKLAFPRVPNMTVPTNLNEAWRLDLGPEWKNGVITKQPPVVGKAFPVLVPQVDADGNDRAGVHIPEMRVPLATYTGWNLRDPSIGAPDQRVSFIGSYVPFAKTAAEREKTGDRRLSIAERYTGREDYLKRYRDAADELVRERWLLPEDVPAVMDRGAHEWDAALAVTRAWARPPARQLSPRRLRLRLESQRQ
jgi:hypothetical protein